MQSPMVLADHRIKVRLGTWNVPERSAFLHQIVYRFKHII